jgi:hypothetical protein
MEIGEFYSAVHELQQTKRFQDFQDTEASKSDGTSFSKASFLQLTILAQPSPLQFTCTNMTHVNQRPVREALQSVTGNLVSLIAARCC